MTQRTIFLLLCGLVCLPLFAAEYTAPTAAELAQARAWIAAHWNFNTEPAVPPVGLTVYANNDPVRPRAPGSANVHISGTKYDRGLYCHAVSDIGVLLEKPANTFTAVVGIDSNPDTRGGKGSVRFVVKVGGEEKFRSALLREGTPPVNVRVDLNGSKEFSLIIEDGGDGISHDQSNWALAKVDYADGSSQYLDELPIHAPNRAGGLPFSFRYGDRTSDEFLKTCQFMRVVERGRQIRRTLTWLDPKTKLEVKMVGIQYIDYPVVEWTIYFTNKGTEKTPLLSNVNAIDMVLPQSQHHEAYLHHNNGSPSAKNDYEPRRTHLPPGARLRFSGRDGRGSDGDWPYFNVARGGQDKDGGTIVVVGWPGQWEGEFFNSNEGNSRGQIQFRAGQERVSCSLMPGETFRTPRIALLFWDGEKNRSQNVWRRWFLAHNAPKLSNGKVPPFHWTVNTSIYYWEMINANTENQIMFIDKLLENGLFIDYWWMDAGWYTNNGHWANTGTWEVDKNRFPKGLREISDHAKTKGVKTLVWFEPERVTEGTWLKVNHPEWVLGDGYSGLLNLGNPEAWKWLVEHIDSVITSEGIGLYRQDFNMGPLGRWRANDAADRQGITENLHVQGYLAFWDELRRRHPDMPIDSCASGGRRNDLETLKRSIILHRSDNYDPVGNQGQSYGLALWTPLAGIGASGADQYNFRSMMGPFQNSSFDVREDSSGVDAKFAADNATLATREGTFDFAIARKYQADWKRCTQYYGQDYYPLTPYSLDESTWLAWQYVAYDGSGGIVQIFKRSQSPYETARLRMYGLDPNATYVFEDFDGNPEIRSTGKELMEQGLQMTITERRVSRILEFRRID
ncbi:MAG: alpha-galactosidase [Planctomycetaceae bacterium]|nr:alpha-galactosidase [Planctomycetaceae bacterium]